MKKVLIVFSGYNQRAVIAFLRSLEKNNIQDYAIISMPDDDILMTQYQDKVIYIRESAELSLRLMNEVFSRVKEKTNAEKVIIAPSTEGLIRFIIDNRSAIEGIGFEIPIVDNDLYIKVSDKLSFIEMCENYDIKVPKRIESISEDNISMVAKPKRYYSSEGDRLTPQLINSEADLHCFKEQYDENDFFFEEMLTGESYYLLLYLSRSNETICFSQKNLIQLSGGGSMIAAECADIHEHSIANKYIRMLKNEGFHGIVMIELRYFCGEFYMIEANPRFWGPSQLVVDANIPIFEAFLRDIGFIDDIPKRSVDLSAKYFWSTGIRQATIIESDCMMHEGSEELESNYSIFCKYDLYNRPDTIEIYYKEAKKRFGKRLLQLYRQNSKHCGYQMLTEEIARIIEADGLPFNNRYEQERLHYIMKHIELKDKTVSDIGGNTGYFTFEALKHGAIRVDYYEGNSTHAEFVRIAKELYGGNINVFNSYYDFFSEDRKCDTIFCLNVLHHLGDDFHSLDDMQVAKKEMVNSINALAGRCEFLILQIGFNWKGNRNKCLFKNGTKSEMIDFIRDSTNNFWKIEAVGVAVDKGGYIMYDELNDDNISRSDKLGEFLNRPIFVMRSICE